MLGTTVLPLWPPWSGSIRVYFFKWILYLKSGVTCAPGQTKGAFLHKDGQINKMWMHWSHDERRRDAPGSCERHLRLRGQRAAGTPKRHVTGWQQHPAGMEEGSLIAAAGLWPPHRQVQVLRRQNLNFRCKTSHFCRFNRLVKSRECELLARPLSDSYWYSFHYRTTPACFASLHIFFKILTPNKHK